MSATSNDTVELPVPKDDGACDHLTGLTLPNIDLPATSGGAVNFSQLSGLVVIYIYPRTGQPNVALPDGWEQIPGAMGCTPQSCAFRDHHGELEQLNASVFGLSTQDSAYQQEAAQRLQLNFPLVSDEQRSFIDALKLPTFEAAGMVLGKRVTLVARDGVIEKVFYPVFPPGDNAAQVVNYLQQQGG